MPISWTISPADKFVTVRAEGVCARSDVEALLDAVIVADAMPWPKIFFATTFEPQGNSDDIMLLGARMRAYAGVTTFGPLAFVVADEAVRQRVNWYIELTRANRPTAMFPDEAKARKWLATQ